MLRERKKKKKHAVLTDFKINVLCKYAISHEICGFKILTLSNMHVNRTQVLQSRYRPLKNTEFCEMMQSILLMISSKWNNEVLLSDLNIYNNKLKCFLFKGNKCISL